MTAVKAVSGNIKNSSSNILPMKAPKQEIVRTNHVWCTC